MLSETQTIILEHFSTFGYLTVSHLIDLIKGLNNRQHVNRICKKLVDDGLLEKNENFGPPRRETFYYLSTKGFRLCKQFMHPSQAMRLTPPPRNVVFAQDFEHRKLLIDFQINLHLQCECTDYIVHQFDRYFDKDQRGRKSQRRYAKTAIPLRDDQWLIPDANVLLLPKDHEDYPVKQNSRLFLLEVARGKDVQRMYRQLLRHIDLMRTSNIQEALGFSLPYLVVFLVEDPIVIYGLKKRFLDDFQSTPWLDYVGFLSPDPLINVFHSLRGADNRRLYLLPSEEPSEPCMYLKPTFPWK